MDVTCVKSVRVSVASSEVTWRRLQHHTLILTVFLEIFSASDKDYNNFEKASAVCVLGV